MNRSYKNLWNGRALDIENTANSKVLIESVSDDEVSQVLAGRSMPLDHLNYLEKRLDSFTDQELKTFCAAAQVDPPQTSVELIDLTYNLHCFCLMDDTQDMKSMGRAFYLQEQISCSTEELDQLGQSYLAEFMGKYTPWETRQGLLYPNKNQPEPVFTGPCLPEFLYEQPPINVQLCGTHPTQGACTEILGLPWEGDELAKIMERMKVTDCSQVRLGNILSTMPHKIEEIVFQGEQTAGDLGAIQDIATFYQLGTEKMKEQLLHFVEQLELTTAQEICEISLALVSDELEFIPDISTAEEYGYYLVCENEATKIDDDMGAFVDYLGYGDSQLYGVSYTDTKDGLVIYKVNCRQAREGALGHHGESAGMEQMLENFKQEQEQISMADLT